MLELEIEENVIYVIKINEKLYTITKDNIILSADSESKNIVAMIDDKVNVKDISQAIDMIKKII